MADDDKGSAGQVRTCDGQEWYFADPPTLEFPKLDQLHQCSGSAHEIRALIIEAIEEQAEMIAALCRGRRVKPQPDATKP